MALNIENAGIFAPTSENLDISGIEDENLRQIFIELINIIGEMSRTINLRESGIYSLEETVSGQIFFPDQALSSLTAKAPIERPGLRTTLITGALLNAATKSVPHGITVTANTSFTKILGTADDPIGNNHITLPFVDVGGVIAAGNIELRVDATNVLITTTGNGTNFTRSKVILEYLQE